MLTPPIRGLELDLESGKPGADAHVSNEDRELSAPVVDLTAAARDAIRPTVPGTARLLTNTRTRSPGRLRSGTFTVPWPGFPAGSSLLSAPEPLIDVGT